MKTIAAIITIMAAAGLATSAIAQARHDERPHGYNAKAAVEQLANTTRPVPFATGPRPHDAVRRVAKSAPVSQPTTAVNTEEKK